MPKTKKQELAFSILMSLIMTYAMETYNLSLIAGRLENQIFIEVFHDLVFIACIVFLLEKFIASRIVERLMQHFFSTTPAHPFVMMLARQGFTVFCMSPMMSLIATILFKHPGQIISVWLQTTALNLPFAFFWQIFFAGPFVRTCIQKCFSKYL